jgi:hypothetical protein
VSVLEPVECRDDVAALDPDEIQRQIVGHLAAHPDCEDTLEGIAEWWLLERAIECRLRDVQAAVDRLVDQGVLEGRGGTAGPLRYRLHERPRREERLADRARGAPPETDPEGEAS